MQASAEPQHERLGSLDDYCGGCLPTEVVLTLPKFFFSAEFLSNLAPCSKDLLRAVSDARNWTNKTIFADDDEFQNSAALRQAERVWGLAEHVVLRVPQLACVSNWPESILLQWSGWPVVRPRQQSDQVHAWESQILLGSARFTLVAPVFTQVLYVGLQAPDSDRRIFCKLSLPFTSFMTVDFGLSGGFLARRASSLPGFRAGTQHDIVVQWDTRWFAVHLDGALLSHAILADDTQDAPPAQARLFIWAITVPYTLQTPLIVQPQPTWLAAGVAVTCCVCGRSGLIRSGSWGVCTLCQNWVCREHVRRTPLRRCPTCVLPLQDYFAGKTVDDCAEDFMHLIEIAQAQPVLAEPVPTRPAGRVFESNDENWDGVLC